MFERQISTHASSRKMRAAVGCAMLALLPLLWVLLISHPVEFSYCMARSSLWVLDLTTKVIYPWWYVLAGVCMLIALRDFFFTGFNKQAWLWFSLCLCAFVLAYSVGVAKERGVIARMGAEIASEETRSKGGR